MKKIILIIMIGLFSLMGYGQEVLKLNAYAFSFSQIGEKIPDMNPVDILITVKNARFIIYSKEKQIYDAISSNVLYDNNNNKWVTYKCITSEGKTVNLSYHIMENGDCLISIDNEIYTWSYLCTLLE